jgi:hypothetical protein
MAANFANFFVPVSTGSVATQASKLFCGKKVSHQIGIHTAAEKKSGNLFWSREAPIHSDPNDLSKIRDIKKDFFYSYIFSHPGKLYVTKNSRS